MMNPAREYAKAIAKAPTDVEINEQFAELYRERMENPAEAEKLLNQLVAAVGDDPGARRRPTSPGSGTITA